MRNSLTLLLARVNRLAARVTPSSRDVSKMSDSQLACALFDCAEAQIGEWSTFATADAFVAAAAAAWAELGIPNAGRHENIARHWEHARWRRDFARSAGPS